MRMHITNLSPHASLCSFVSMLLSDIHLATFTCLHMPPIDFHIYHMLNAQHKEKKNVGQKPILGVCLVAFGTH